MGARTGTALPGSHPQSRGCLHPQGREFPAWALPDLPAHVVAVGRCMAQASARCASSRWNRCRWVCSSQSVLPPLVGSGHGGPACLSRAHRPTQRCRSWPPAHRPAGTYLRREEAPRDHLSSRHDSVPHQAAVLGQHSVQVPDLVLKVFLVAPREVPAIR